MVQKELLSARIEKEEERMLDIEQKKRGGEELSEEIKGEIKRKTIEIQSKKLPTVKEEDIKRSMAQKMLKKAFQHKIRSENPNITEKEFEKEVAQKVRSETEWLWDTESGMNSFKGDKTKISMEEALTYLMKGRAGLLRRCLKFEKSKKSSTFEHLRPILGDIAPNCQDPNHCKNGTEHSTACFMFEADIIMAYTGHDKLNFVIR